jgi:hypothetical protein
MHFSIFGLFYSHKFSPKYFGWQSGDLQGVALLQEYKKTNVFNRVTVIQ